MGRHCRHVEPLRQPCFPARAGGRRRDRRRQRLGPDASGPARCRRAARRRDAALSEASFLRRIYLRPQLGERLHPRRRKLLSENAVGSALHPGDRPAISRRRCRARPRRAASRRAGRRDGAVSGAARPVVGACQFPAGERHSPAGRPWMDDPLVDPVPLAE